MAQTDWEYGHIGVLIRIEDTRPPEIPHDLIVKEAFQAIATELDENGNSPRLAELRKKYFDIFAIYWQHVLNAYMEEHAKLGPYDDDLNGDEIAMGDGVVSLTAMDAGYAGDAVRLELKRGNAFEQDKLSLVVHHTGEIDELFMPSLSVTLQPNTDSADTEDYIFEFLNGRILSILRDKHHEDPTGTNRPVYERRRIEFSRFESIPSSSPQLE